MLACLLGCDDAALSFVATVPSGGAVPWGFTLAHGGELLVVQNQFTGATGHCLYELRTRDIIIHTAMSHIYHVCVQWLTLFLLLQRAEKRTQKAR